MEILDKGPEDKDRWTRNIGQEAGGHRQTDWKYWTRGQRSSTAVLEILDKRLEVEDRQTGNIGQGARG